MNRPNVAIITYSTGRPELVRAMASVQAQSYPCKHYIFVDGPQYAEAVRETVQALPKAAVVYLPFSSGGAGKSNGPVYAAAPFLVEEEIICYLDEMHFFDPQHIAGLIAVLQQNNADYAYSLRNFVDEKGHLICRDDSESLGSWPSLFYNKNTEFDFEYDGTRFNCTRSINTEHHINPNCYAFTRKTALALAHSWNKKEPGNDRDVFRFLTQNPPECFHGVGSGLYTLNYFIDPLLEDSSLHKIFAERFNTAQINEIAYLLRRLTNKKHVEAYGGTPWAK